MYLSFNVWTTDSISHVSTNGDCALIGRFVVVSMYKRSHFPTKSSAHFLPRIVIESTCETTQKAILVGIFALMSHVITFTDGLCVATIR